MVGFTGRVAEFCQQDVEPPARSARADEGRPPRRASRRRLLAAGGGAAATLLSGCSSILPGSDETDDDPTDDPTAGTDTPTRRPPEGEADVTGLMFREDGQDYRFFVVLKPAIRSRGADWWQVETLDGTKISRKEFDGPRTGEKFETAKTISVDDPGAGVVVRGHDVDTGYGGQVMLAKPDENRIELAKQGSEKESFEDFSF